MQLRLPVCNLHAAQLSHCRPLSCATHRRWRLREGPPGAQQPAGAQVSAPGPEAAARHGRDGGARHLLQPNAAQAGAVQPEAEKVPGQVRRPGVPQLRRCASVALLRFQTLCRGHRAVGMGPSVEPARECYETTVNCETVRLQAKPHQVARGAILLLDWSCSQLQAGSLASCLSALVRGYTGAA